MNRIKFHVRKGDNVEVISGNFRGSRCKILQLLPRKQRVLIEGVRIIKKHLKKSQDNPSGKIAEREGPIHISNVRLIERDEKPPKEKNKPGKRKSKWRTSFIAITKIECCRRYKSSTPTKIFIRSRRSRR